MTAGVTLADFPPLVLVGCGAMGGALLHRWRECGLPDARVTVVDPQPRGLPEGFAGRHVKTAAEAQPTELVVLGIKPQMLAAAAPELAGAVAPGGTLVSMLAGVTTATLAARFPQAGIVRIMPNTPVRIGLGVTAAFAPAGGRAAVDALLAPTGRVLWLERETLFDAVTAVSGSGPAYLFRFIEALEAAAVASGFEPAAAAELARGTVTGAAALAQASAESPADLRRAVTSPNGTTQAGLAAMEGIDALMTATVAAAAARSAQMAREAA
jgi:pyrroline-5-carboxylate reductase